MNVQTPFKLVPLQKVVYFQEGPGLRKWQYSNKGIAFLNIRTIGDDGFIKKDLCNFIAEEEVAEKYKHFLLNVGDLVVSSSGTLGKLAVVREEDLPLMLNTSVIRFTSVDKNILCPSYLKWFIKSPLYIRQINNASTGIAIKNYGPSHLRKIKIPLPPIDEQHRIAAILDKAAAISRKRQKAIQLADDFLRAVFLDMFGDPVTNPRGWESKLVGELLIFLTSGSRGWAKYYSKKGHLFLRIQNLGNNQLILDDVALVDPPNNAEAKRTKVHPGDVLLSITADLGRTAIVPDTVHTAYINQHLAILRFRDVEPVYASAYLSSKGGQHQIKKLNRGGVKAGLNFDDIKSLKILLPRRDLQKHWAQIYKKHMLQQVTHKNALSTSSDLFNSLTQRAFQGEL